MNSELLAVWCNIIATDGEKIRQNYKCEFLKTDYQRTSETSFTLSDKAITSFIRFPLFASNPLDLEKVRQEVIEDFWEPLFESCDNPSVKYQFLLPSSCTPFIHTIACLDYIILRSVIGVDFCASVKSLVFQVAINTIE